MVALHVPVAVHLTVVGVRSASPCRCGARAFLPDDDASRAAATRPAERRPARAWTEPRTLLVGVFVLAFAFAEGTGNDWIGVAIDRRLRRVGRASARSPSPRSWPR